MGYRSTGKKLVIVPEEAETVRLIFTRYSELGSIGALIAELDRRGIRTKACHLANGRVRGNLRFGAGALAHLLKNRTYIGEVVYRGEVHLGEHEPILDRGLFEAVQATLAANAVARGVRLKGSLAILGGLLFDGRGNRMSPSHSNKRGVRYRYYVSHALLQRHKTEVKLRGCQPPEIEALVLDGVRHARGGREMRIPRFFSGAGLSKKGRTFAPPASSVFLRRGVPREARQWRVSRPRKTRRRTPSHNPGPDG